MFFALRLQHPHSYTVASLELTLNVHSCVLASPAEVRVEVVQSNNRLQEMHVVKVIQIYVVTVFVEI